MGTWPRGHTLPGILVAHRLQPCNSLCCCSSSHVCYLHPAQAKQALFSPSSPSKEAMARPSRAKIDDADIEVSGMPRSSGPHSTCRVPIYPCQPCGHAHSRSSYLSLIDLSLMAGRRRTRSRNLGAHDGSSSASRLNLTDAPLHARQGPRVCNRDRSH